MWSPNEMLAALLKQVSPEQLKAAVKQAEECSRADAIVNGKSDIPHALDGSRHAVRDLRQRTRDMEFACKHKEWLANIGTPPEVIEARKREALRMEQIRDAGIFEAAGALFRARAGRHGTHGGVYAALVGKMFVVDAPPEVVLADDLAVVHNVGRAGQDGVHVDINVRIRSFAEFEATVEALRAVGRKFRGAE